ncbi:MAG: type II CRISPR RNA-guided endonuclease Cas9 [Bacteroidales bacterium]|nr:type II CRISPR RNA-guided endonuclease Cas9 [Bacteroidales bacterium]
MKRILGLDLGTNSIGWAVTLANEIEKDGKITLQPYKIEAANSRIIPMDAAILGDFDNGNSVSQTANRTAFRGTRRLRERSLLRRERMHRVLDLMGFLPEHYSSKLDRYGKFIDDSEPKIPWKRNEFGKYEFLFTDSFNEMLCEFQELYLDIKIPYDWTIYYLRKKALSKPISKYELVWILLNFNQKRGYYQLRGEDDIVDENKDVKFYALKVVKVEATDDKKGNDVWYNVHLENGMIYRRSSSVPLDWEGKIKEFIVTTDLNDDGTPKTDKDGNIKRSFRSPKEDDWNLLKVKTENDILNSDKTVGCYIYDNILQNPQQKIIGKLVRTIERKFYKEELRLILEKQKEFIPELQDENLYKACIEELYPNNEAHRNNIAKPDFANLFINDILFYQRPLKSKKSLISDCPYESHFDKDGNEYPIKCIAKSNPLFQEFRLWQFVQNLKIYQRERNVGDGQLDLFGNVSSGKLQTDVDVTDEFLKNEDDYVALFDWLNNRATIKQDTLLNSYFKIKKEKGKDNYPYRWNYVEDKEYPCNETRAEILKGLEKCGICADFLTEEQEMFLWHILYSVEDKIEIGKAVKKYADKNNLPQSFVEVFAKIKPFKKEYGSYSEKAIKKLLPLMRIGKYWREDAIDNKTKERIEKIITGEYDDKIKDRVREKTINLTDISQFKGLPLWLACYVVYDRHSEAKEITKWESPDDIDTYLKNFKQHSLRNPIVEQIVTETLRTVRDIWKKYGRIDEIHVELGREMKNPADKRKRMTAQIQENENTNLRIKAILQELINPEYKVENVRPYSPMQQEILKIYEEYAIDNLDKNDKDFDFVSKISKNAQPSKSDIIRYKAWLEQKYRSPYTGKTIPLGKLFTSAYQIEHIIPQSRYFDDSFSNKVICEAEVNQLKDRQLGYEFIKNHHGEKVQLTGGDVVEIFSVEAYEDFVKKHYSGIKKTKLLMEDIPDKFIERQMNDSRYISKFIKGLLSNIVREKDENGEYEQEAVSKNLISCNGTITDRLKKDWGVDNVWNKIILPRFERLNDITGKDCFTAYNTEGHVIPNMPLELQKGFNKKRIDHRHHAMDAIVIACTTRDHVNLLNNEAAHSKHNANRYQLSKKLRRIEKVIVNGKEQDVFKEFYKPWDSFVQDVYVSLNNMIVSFKQNLRVVNKTVNKYEHYDGNGKKVITKQIKGDSWAIRKSLHKDTVFGEVNLRKVKETKLSSVMDNPVVVVDKELKTKIFELKKEGKNNKEILKYFDENKDVWTEIKSGKVQVYYFTKETKDRFFATRKPLDTSFVKKKIENEVTDTGIQKILLAHLKAKDDNSELAFSPDGIDEMNRNIVALNNGKPHQPILKVRVYEKADKFAIGNVGGKSKKFVEAAKGTNLFFAVYTIDKLDKKTGNVEKIRTFATVPLNIVIDCQKQYQKEWKVALDKVLKEKEFVDDNAELQFVISPNDLVYVPTSEELRNEIVVALIDKGRIYKMVSSSGNQCFFVNENVANTIVNKVEFSSLNKMERSITGEMIKEICVPIKVDRLGEIIEFNGNKV